MSVLSPYLSSIAHADLADWTTVAGYLLAALVSARAAGHARALGKANDRSFWRNIAVLLVLFAINELLDLQTLLTLLGRAHAKANGWYERRRMVQHAFVLALGVSAISAGLVMLGLTRRRHPTIRLALAGIGFIGVFVLLRAASIHHLDELLGRGAPEFNWGSWQEVIGILIVAVAAALYSRWARSGRRAQASGFKKS